MTRVYLSLNGGSEIVVRGNQVAGNEGYGIYLNGDAVDTTVVQSNVVGLTADGTAELSNSGVGIWLDDTVNVNVGGPNPSDENLISGNGSYGIIIGNSRNTRVENNLVGTNASGMEAVANGRHGLLVDGASHLSINDNVLSGNGNNGALVREAFDAEITGNLIGVAIDGESALGNEIHGLAVIESQKVLLRDNVISDNDQNGVDVSYSGDYGDFFQWSTADGGNGNWYWLTPDRQRWLEHDALATSVGASLVTVNTAEENEFITSEILPFAQNGFAWHGFNDVNEEGIFTWSSGEPVNYTNWRSGEPNGGTGENFGHFYSDGLWNDLFDSARAHAIIEFSSAPNMDLIADHYGKITIAGNHIGTNQDGTVALGNNWDGIRVQESQNVNIIDGNVIANNNGDGIVVLRDGTTSTIQGNSIHSNIQLGIDLHNDGADTNDADDSDVGANGLQNHPILSLNLGGSEAMIEGRLHSTANESFVIELFSDDATESALVEGKTFLAQETVSTDSNGLATFTFPASLAGPDRFVTATATNAAGQTSEFTPQPLNLQPQIYVGELSEGNADQWSTFTQGDYASSITDSTMNLTRGEQSLRFDTAAPFDTGVVFPKAADALWDLTELTHFSFDLFAENDNEFGFQGAQPIVVFHAPGGSVRYTPGFQMTPDNGAASIKIPLAGDDDWIREVIGSPDLTNVNQIEIHQDTWADTFTIWYDNVFLYEEIVDIIVDGEAIESSLSLGAGQPGELRSRTVTVRNKSDSPITFQPASLTGSFVLETNFAADQVLAAGESFDLQLSHISDAEGTFLGELELINDALPTPTDVLTVGATHIEGLRLVKDLNPGLASSFVGGMVELDGVLYFTARTEQSGRELWRSDGTVNGTYLVKEFINGSEDGVGRFAPDLVIHDGFIYFTAKTEPDGNLQLFRSDGTTDGTQVVFDSTPNSPFDAFLSLGSVNSGSGFEESPAFFFAAEDGINGTELWRSDGTSGGTVLVKDIIPDFDSGLFDDGSHPNHFVSFQGITYFGTFGSEFAEIYRTDGTEAGTQPLIVNQRGEITRPYFQIGSNLEAVGDKLILGLETAELGEEIWVSDGTELGTELLLDLNPGPDSSDLAFVANRNGQLLFFATDESEIPKLWTTDGTSEGTEAIANLQPSGSSNGFPQLSHSVGSLSYFYAVDPETGKEIYVSDGTSAGTRRLFDLNPGSADNIGNTQAVNRIGGTLFFGGDDGTTGRELWAYDISTPDTISPSSQVDVLPRRADSSTFDVTVSGADHSDLRTTERVSGIESYDIYVATPDSAFTFWTTVSADDPTAMFDGDSNTTYFFRSVAHDVAGNTESEALAADTLIYVPDFTPPSSMVTSLQADGPIIHVDYETSDLGGGQTTEIQLYVSIDGDTPVLIHRTSPTSPDGSGTQSGSLDHVAVADGISHEYRFYTVAIDSNGNEEAAPVAGDQAITMTIDPPTGVELVQLDVAGGARQRSFIRNVDLTFASETGLADIVQSIDDADATNDQIRLQKFDLAGSGTPTDIALDGLLSVSGPQIQLDFGPGGVLNSPGSELADGYYEISIDSDDDGDFDQIVHFYRLRGDLDGNRQVDRSDLRLVSRAIARRNGTEETDGNGDGDTNIFDRLLVGRSLGNALDGSLPLDD